MQPRMPMALPSISEAINNATIDSVVMRIGQIVKYDWARITIAISGSNALVDAAYLLSYQPVLGDYVSIVKQGNTWLCLGTYSGVIQDNSCKNGSFEDSAAGFVPNNWTLDAAAGPVTDIVTDIYPNLPYDSRQVCEVKSTGAGAIACTLYSDAITVTGNQRWSVSAWVRCNNISTIDNITVTALASWYVAASDAHTAPISSVTGSVWVVRYGIPWILLRVGDLDGMYPAGTASCMRVRFTIAYTATAANQGVYLDRVIARHIGA